MGLKAEKRGGSQFHGGETSVVRIPVWRRTAGAGLGKMGDGRGEGPSGKEVDDPV